jgi:hypothetical protein
MDRVQKALIANLKRFRKASGYSAAPLGSAYPARLAGGAASWREGIPRGAREMGNLPIAAHFSGSSLPPGGSANRDIARHFGRNRDPGRAGLVDRAGGMHGNL